MILSLLLLVAFAEAAVEDGLFIRFVVAVFVFQISNSPAGLAVVVHARWIVCHLRDPQLSIGAPVDCNRVNDKWFGNNQLKFKPLTDVSNFHRLRRRHGRCIRTSNHLVDLWFQSGFCDRKVGRDFFDIQHSVVQSHFVQSAFQPKHTIISAAKKDIV